MKQPMTNHKYLDETDIVVQGDLATIIFLCETTKLKRSKYQFYLKKKFDYNQSYLVFYRHDGQHGQHDIFDLDIRNVCSLVFSLIEGFGEGFFVNHDVNPNVHECVRSTKKFMMDSILKLDIGEPREVYISNHYHLIKIMFSDQQRKTYWDENSYKFFHSKIEVK